VAVLSCVDVFTAYLPVLGERVGITPFAVGALLALRAAASIVSRLGITSVVRVFGRVRLIAISAAISAAAPLTHAPQLVYAICPKDLSPVLHASQRAGLSPPTRGEAIH